MSRLDDMHAAILAMRPGERGPIVPSAFVLELIERIWALEVTVAKLAELAKGANGK